MTSDVRVVGASFPSDPPADLVAAAHAICDDVERARADRFATAVLRARWLLGRAWVRAVVGDELGVAADRLDLRVEASGRPVVDGRGLSIAHTDRAIVVATSDGGVGVDAEREDRLVDVGAAALVLSAAELDAAGSPPSARALLEAWTRKEAFAKWRGTGLTDALVGVTLWPEPEPGLGVGLWSGRASGHVWSVAGSEPPAVAWRSLPADVRAAVR